MKNSSAQMEEIYLKYCIPLKKFAFTLCRNEDLADDIVSETFYRAIKNFDNYREGNLFAWLCTIAKNTYFNHLKKKDNLHDSIDDENFREVAGGDDVEAEVMKREEQRKLSECIGRLSDIEREVVNYRINTGLSFKEIGDVLHKSENWARVTFYRCKEKLKGMMNDEE
ncbi:MAG: RNA polymerase sigma factor [Lachnospiraceae bacterium]|nr:RNA polymerase sigma factor [Lachnospiraceae bacterium]